MEFEASTDPELRKWAPILHLSQFLGYVFPLAGWVAPIAIWQVKKVDCPELDAHGRQVVDWLITELVAGFLLGVMVLVSFLIPPFLLVTIPLAWLGGILLALLAVVHPIIAAVKAGDGELWSYPGSMRFLSR